MAILIGIDEAGYGPILGPLVVSAAGFSLPERLLNQSLWRILSQSVHKKPAGGLGRVVINDSKKLHRGKGNYQLLQRGVLSFLSAESGLGPPATLAQLLNLLDCNNHTQLSEYPWYDNLAGDYPLRYSLDDITIAAGALAADLKNKDMKIVGLWSQPVMVGEFNQLVAATNNKASVLFTRICQLVDRGYRRFGKENLQFVIDRQSGRSHYRTVLQRMFPELKLKILKEEPSVSSYHLAGPSGMMKIHFLAQGDDRQLPISLASMTCKYLRELFMELLNNYFQKHCPGITTTAGYYTDGQRFLADLKKFNLPPSLAPHNLLVRER